MAQSPANATRPFYLNRPYVQSQQMAQDLLAAGSLGLVYPSVRRPHGTCLACFRPALVGHVRRGTRYLFAWSGSPTPRISEITP